MPKTRILPPKPEIQWQEVFPLIEKAAEDYSGPLDTLERAIGALVMGKLFGWKVLRILHSPATYAKYEDVLQVKLRDVCDAETSWSIRSYGFQYAKQLGDFWEVIRKNLVPKDKRNLQE